ncbi:hypothetical protein AFLA_012888 [Aspergillus flavus NRRL3357]|nr:hypothetical protein AFLA_012888 [Aspergillus flavus NRRL3357]
MSGRSSSPSFCPEERYGLKSKGSSLTSTGISNLCPERRALGKSILAATRRADKVNNLLRRGGVQAVKEGHRDRDGNIVLLIYLIANLLATHALKTLLHSEHEGVGGAA